MIRVALAGGRGYVGEELLRILAGIPEYEVVYVGSRSSAGLPVAEEYNDLDLDLHFQDLSTESIQACAADVWVIAQPNGQAATLVELISDSKAKLIDISSDFRFDDDWVYGLPEQNLASIKTATRIANPGCYATATLLALLPHVDQMCGMSVAFGISGYSGAGRTPGDKNNPQRLHDNILPYSLTGHTHELEVSRHLGQDVRLIPHVASFFRGITVTLNVQFATPTNAPEVLDRTREYYSSFPLVDVVDTIPEIQQVAGTNRAMVGGITVDARNECQVALVSVIDNLRKGAAAQVVQNINLMFGFKSEHGLESS